MLCTALVMAGSLALTTAVVAHAYYLKHQFYPTVVYLTKSSPSMAVAPKMLFGGLLAPQVLYIQAFVLVFLLGKFMGKVFFGQLRAAEMEHLLERSWYAVTETCLAFTVFRDDFSPRFVALFTLLLFLKCFHWLAEDRVDFMERSPNISWLFHFRIVSLMFLLGILDFLFVSHAYHSILTRGASVQLVFGFEVSAAWRRGPGAGPGRASHPPPSRPQYAILMTMVLTIFIKYVLHSVDLQNENPWDNKAVFMLYTELFTGLIKVLLYMAFMTIMIKVHTFPLFAIRPMYLAMRQFKKAVTDAIMSRRAIRNMNTLYPDATAEELQAMDNVCIICREEMVTGAKRLPCNHIFHTRCPFSGIPGIPGVPGIPGMGVGDFVDLRILDFVDLRVRGFCGFVGSGFGDFGFCGFVGSGVGDFGFCGFCGFAGSGFGDFVDLRVQDLRILDFVDLWVRDSGILWICGFACLGSGDSPGPAAVPPMPVPPAGFAGLTEEELRAMEGSERQHLEARLQCLHNIHTLLDAAMLQINQYLSVLGALG
ncbi:hypothetical protein DUI87_33102 [Hirundo rustica rustica]|uniref:E3 ubiquitin-protein ligase synoviolin-like TPR repeats domain-containing protein n=12 Tax=Passeriformes TaxID=9126 RepID=A0A3M0IMA7_HIRRU|nr:hypothetical protein DUI87_33102 [Hirundo rustica rustica]